MSPSRRDFLIGLSASAPLAGFAIPNPLWAQDHSQIMAVSNVITGRNDLDPKIGERIETLLSKRIDGFADALDGLAQTLASKAGRDEALAALTEDQTKLALAIAQPWYVGFIGTPPSFASLESDSEFVTYLQANAYDLVLDVVPRPGLSTGAPGWWADVPPGVKAPAMPDEIKGWSYQPSKIASEIATADPAYLALVTGKAKSIDEARKETTSAAPETPSTATGSTGQN